ncbi:hypothetical protein CANTEDRAFT_115628 [Yamadazyma tenuis ATCC 10573]|uniref:Uncharacterized protein n=1 Tax=Candida tenuis (strain ATCC 10573 / BCRC 21748 / CBS 615 / JCM 9827 / NBRC 10315 / NRRL Y-1498 / VKM Y-70) TaxID=590646 RepID=G3BBD3_CANTC|nr:uncharacterized protein CANTEDRAFT_115628 [Yamadazyma tenuis ATCC 10573]EGV62160.1 hypothetical protein CANTEDRAFT_115628 [Yamadazyma tenuis ATCC 10573]
MGTHADYRTPVVKIARPLCDMFPNWVLLLLTPMHQQPYACNRDSPRSYPLSSYLATVKINNVSG